MSNINAGEWSCEGGFCGERWPIIRNTLPLVSYKKMAYHKKYSSTIEL